jgi:hypothetical protein
MCMYHDRGFVPGMCVCVYVCVCVCARARVIECIYNTTYNKCRHNAHKQTNTSKYLKELSIIRIPIGKRLLALAHGSDK